MKPALLTYPFISSYPVLMLLGFFFAWLLSRKRAPFYRVDVRHFDNLILLVPISGIFGARFFARLFYAKLPLFEALKVWQGDGLVFYGGLIFSVATVVLYGWIRRLNLLALCDSLAPGVAVGLAFGRIGCFLAGCCWGDLCVDSATLAHQPPEIVRQVQTIPALSFGSWRLAVRFPPQSEPFKQHAKLGLIEKHAASSLPVHPVQVYEAALAGALALWLHFRFLANHRPGSPSIALFAGYAVIRFATEYFRADNKPYWLDLTISQVISLEILALCGAAIIVRWALRRTTRAMRAAPAEVHEAPVG
jgi:phosphatidylglycerol:prolipoprotein diacylglycerol transferase